MTISPRGSTLDKAVDELEAAWRAGKPPDLSLVLRQANCDREALALELALVDMELRWRSSASDGVLPEKPNLDDYARILPELAALQPFDAALVGEEYRVCRLWGDEREMHAFRMRRQVCEERLHLAVETVEGELAKEAPQLPYRRRMQRNLRLLPPQLDYADFQLVRLIGSGGMGKVYLARRKADGRDLAIKALLKSRQSDELAVERFLDETSCLAALDHPSIVRLHGLGQFPGGGVFSVLDFVAGGDMLRRINAGHVSHQDAALWAAQAAEAVQHAHDNGVVHCDLKPANILLDHDNSAVVSDFGLAQLLHPAVAGAPATFGGTWAYMAPEQLVDDVGVISPRTDVYGLGAVLFHALTGQPPMATCHVAQDEATLARQIKLLGTAPTDLRDVCLACLRVAPHDRIPTAHEVAQRLDSWRHASL